MGLDPWREAKRAFNAWMSSDTFFRCEYCAIDYAEEDLLFGHIDKIHRVSKEKYAKDNPGYTKKSVWLTCQICEMDMGSVVEHLSRGRCKMAPEVYFVRKVHEGVKLC